jgi:hypothetical protein
MSTGLHNKQYNAHIIALMLNTGCSLRTNELEDFIIRNRTSVTQKNKQENAFQITRTVALENARASFVVV